MAILLDLGVQQFPTALHVALSSKIFFQGLPAFASSVAPEQVRGGGYAQGTSHSPQQSGTAECFGGGEPAGVVEINGTVLHRWHTSDSHPKTGQQELLPSPDCELSPGSLWDVAVLTTVRNMNTCKWLV